MSDREQSPSSLIGTVISKKIEIVRALGAGAMGAVYLGHHRALDRPIAIKVITHPTPTLVKRLAVEARAASRLDHPNTVRVLDFGESDDGLLYIAMEYIEGKTLLDLLKAESKLSPTRTIDIMAQVLSALSEAHEKGILHRDLKPSNIMLTRRYSERGLRDDFVKVCDFGLAKLVENDDDAETITQQGTLLGTPAYMSPEQVRRESLDARTDLYACGVILYRALAGVLLFSAKSPFDMALRHLSDTPRPIAEIVSLPPALAEAVHRALAKGRDERFQTAQEMGAAISAAVVGWSDAPLTKSATPADPEPTLPDPPAPMPRLATDAALATTLPLPPSGASTAPSEASVARAIGARPTWAIGLGLAGVLGAGYFLLAPSPPPAAKPSEAIAQVVSADARVEAQDAATTPDVGEALDAASRDAETADARSKRGGDAARVRASERPEPRSGLPALPDPWADAGAD